MTKAELVLRAKIEALKNENRELKETLEAIGAGEVDAIVISRKDDEKKVYTLENADLPYRILIENIREGALTISREGLILYGNSAFSTMRGLPLTGIMGTNLRDHICPRDKERFDLLLRDVPEKPVRCEMSICNAGGSFPVLITMATLNGEGNPKIGALVSDRRKDYSRLLLQSRMLDAVADAVIAADPAGKIIYWNDAATKTYGWKREEAIGRDLVSVAVPEMSVDESREILEKLMTGETWSGEYMVKHRDGHLFPIFSSDAPIFDDDGRLVAVLGASHDISYQKNYERTLRLAKKEAEAALELLQSLYENAGIGFAFLDPELRYRYINRQLADMNGIPAHEHIGRKIQDLIPERWGKLEPVFTGVMQTGRPAFDVEISGISPEKPDVTRYFIENVFRVQLHGEIMGVGVALHEITDRKMMELALRENEKRFRELAEKAGSIILRFDPDGRITYFNEFAEMFFGYSRNEIIGRSAVGSIIPATESGTGRDLGAMVKEIVAYPEKYATNENENIRKNGERVWIHWTNKPVFNPDGTIREFTTIGNDITDRKRAEKALRESEERFHSVLDNSRDVIYRINVRTGRYEYISPSAEIVTGYSHDELKALPAEIAIEMIHPEDRPAFSAMLARVEETGTEDIEYRQRSKTGEYRWLSNHMALTRDKDGKPLYRTGNIRDITRRKQIEESLVRKHAELNIAYDQITSTQEELKTKIIELNARELELNQTLKEKEVLLAEIHHRVKNNLTAFISLLSLEGGYEESPAGLALKKDLQNRARSMALIHETLYRTRNYSNVDMNVYLTTLVDQVVKSYEGTRKIITVVEAPGLTLDLSRATTAGLIINELVTNSFKYAFPPSFPNDGEHGAPALNVSLAKDGNAITLAVKDNGVGLPPGLDPATTKTLGLKLVNFLAKHQLRAKIESSSENEAEFRFRFADVKK